LYLATVIDCFSRQVIGWSMAEHMRAELVVDALTMAAGNGALDQEAIFHSDRGSQYSSARFRTALDVHGVRQSMGRTGVCLLTG
jgi:putative transposase